MFVRTDPRAALTARTADARDADIAAPEYFAFRDSAPDETTALGSRSWVVRAQNFALVYTDAAAGDVFEHRGDHEHVLLLTEPESEVSVVAGDETASATGPGLVVLPPGRSTIRMRGAAPLVRLFDARDTGVVARARNASTYRTPDVRTAPLIPWPEPVTGARLRVYRLADFPPTAGRFGTIFRTSSFMVNFLDPQDGPRDAEALSPHHHDDFQQCSLAVEGEWIHHIRTPWGPRRSRWREDEHRLIGSPSVAIIPPPTIHTSEAFGPGRNRLIDVFSPPREDFSLQPGWVLNAAEYPMPDAALVP